MNLHDFIKAVGFHVLWNDVVEVFSGKCAFFFAVGESAHSLKSHFFHEIHQVVKFFFALTRESHHQRSANVYARHLFAYALNQLDGFSLGDVALHIVEHLIGRVLQSDVEVFAHIIVLRHHGENVVRELGRVGVVQANPLHTLDLRHLVNQLRQHHFAVEVKTVRRQVLRNHVKFLHALAHQVLHLVEQRVHWHRLVAAGD